MTHVDPRIAEVVLGAFNIYNNHSSGAPAYQVGTKMPWAAYPYMNYYGPPHNYSHLLRAERFLHVWLEQNGYEYDVASDFDVHQNPSLFNSYKVVVIAGHSEYWSAQAYSGLKQYVANGGRVFVASGNTMNGSAWVPATGAWDDTLGGQFQATLQAVQWAPNYVSILGVNSAGQLLYRYWDGSAWQPTAGFSTYAAAITGRPTAVGLGRNQLYIYARGTNGVIVAKWWDGANWGPSPTTWDPLGPTVMESDPSAVAFQGRRIGLAALGTNHRLYYKAWDGVSWNPVSSWTDMGGDFKFAPTLLAWGGNKLNVFAVNRVDGKMLTRHFDGTNWDPTWYDLGGNHASRPVAVARRSNELSIFAVGTDGRMKVKWFDGANWSPGPLTWTDLGGSFVGEPTAVSWRGNHVSVMGVSSGGIVQYKWTDGSNWFPSLTTFDNITGGLSGPRPSPTLLSWIGS